jgi:hypothetical protein
MTTTMNNNINNEPLGQGMSLTCENNDNDDDNNNDKIKTCFTPVLIQKVTI